MDIQNPNKNFRREELLKFNIKNEIDTLKEN